jgi:hypothetical protein
MGKKKRSNKAGEMPALTIDGKKEIVGLALKALGEKNFTIWLKENNISSLRYMKENVRKYKSKFFRDMYQLTKISGDNHGNI